MAQLSASSGNETSQLKNVVNNSTAGLRDYFNCKKKDEMDVSLKISPSYLLKLENVEIQAGNLYLPVCNTLGQNLANSEPYPKYSEIIVRGQNL